MSSPVRDALELLDILGRNDSRKKSKDDPVSMYLRVQRLMEKKDKKEKEKGKGSQWERWEKVFFFTCIFPIIGTAQLWLLTTMVLNVANAFHSAPK